MSNTQLGVWFFLEMAVILAVCRLVGLLAKRIGQPQVIAEMVAGVLLGPSLFGQLFPAVQQALFPKQALSVIYVCSQVGLVLYMFLVGVEFDTGLIRQRLRSAASVSLAGILTPFIFGCLLALLLVNVPGMFGKGVISWEAMLFIGAAMSITAFPVLARIIFERGLTGTSLGTLALAAGAMDDVAAWSILAVLLAIFHKNSLVAIAAVLGGLLYAGVILLVVRPLLLRLVPQVENHNGLSGPLLAFILILLMVCAWITDSIGIYAVFGAFILGTAMPRGLFSFHLRRTLEPLVNNFLLPLFFVYSGLNTRLSLVNSLFLWGLALLIFVTASFGKGIACWLAALLNKEPPREALAIGTLMNARGLMELILLNIGLEQGIIAPTLFTMLVLMAIVTTLMTSPIFELVYGRYQKAPAKEVTVEASVRP